MTGACTAQIADPDKPGRLYGCDRGQHAGVHHTRNDRGEDVTWGGADRGSGAPRPAESLTVAYTEHRRAIAEHRAAPTEATRERVRTAVLAVTREEAAYSADCIAAGVPPVARPLPLEGLDL